MALAMHDFDTLDQRHTETEEIAKILGEAKAMLKKRKLNHIEVNYDRMVIRSLDHLRKFAEDALRRIKNYRPPQDTPRAESL